MVSALFRREQLRLAPYGLLAPLAYVIAFLLALVQDRPSDLGAQLFWAGLIGGPPILGVATVVPDTANGGTSFFARLPITPGRVLATKLAAAGAWLSLAIVMAVFGVGILDATGALKLKDSLPMFQVAGAMILGQGCAFSAGALASVTASRVMPAILLTPGLA